MLSKLKELPEALVRINAFAHAVAESCSAILALVVLAYVWGQHSLVTTFSLIFWAVVTLVVLLTRVITDSALNDQKMRSAGNHGQVS